MLVCLLCVAANMAGTGQVSARGGLRQFLESRVMWVRTPTKQISHRLESHLSHYYFITYRCYYHFGLLYLSICATIT
eukprot:COSAG01_NODE_8541_length_2748_cov_3.504719_3_plen_77_part_00